MSCRRLILSPSVTVWAAAGNNNENAASAAQKEMAVNGPLGSISGKLGRFLRSATLATRRKLRKSG